MGIVFKYLLTQDYFYFLLNATVIFVFTVHFWEALLKHILNIRKHLYYSKILCRSIFSYPQILPKFKNFLNKSIIEKTEFTNKRLFILIIIV